MVDSPAGAEIEGRCWRGAEVLNLIITTARSR